MSRTRAVGCLAVLSVVIVMLAACSNRNRDHVESAMSRIVPDTVQEVSDALLSTPREQDPNPEEYLLVTDRQFLAGLDHQKFGSSDGILMYCLEKDGETITVCLIVSLTTSNATSIGVKDAAIYGCARFSGRAGHAEVTVTDEECPPQLTRWFADRLPDPSEKVSISSFSSDG